ncbi:MAG TPA: hypothetical protein VE080_02185 [Candidatus Aquicultoraceae bacterium]|nr:hypothetical protein [Candidatus Aquicultoraceae bacterium]
MGRSRGALIAVVVAVLAAWTATGISAESDAIRRMTKEELKGLLGKPDVQVLDVRLGGERASDRIAGAAYEDPGQVSEWSGKYPRDKRIVLYCS